MGPKKVVANRYEVRWMLGKGGMGQVYLAHDRVLATDVALKRIPLEHALDEAARAAMISEARILAKLSHTHIVRLFDLIDTPEGLYLVLEYVCGPSLDKVLAVRKTLPPNELQYVMDQVGQALARAHALGVIHRDLKPSNLLVALTGDEQRRYLRDRIIPPTLLNAEIKVADFGLAKMVQQSRVEASGIISGTPGYMAPEQFRGELPSVETDIYALGFIAYECLAGKLPIGDAQPVYFHLFVTPPPVPGVPPHLDAAVQRAIRKDRAERFHSAADFVEALRLPVTPPTRPQPSPPPPAPTPIPPSPRPGTNWAVWAILATGLVAIGAVLLLATLRTRRSPAAEAPAAVKTVEAVNLPPLAPLNPAPRIDVLPPVIEHARLTSASAPLPPPVQQPNVLAKLRVTGNSVLGFGPDGTLYVTSDRSDIGAVRNGQLLWQYQLGSDDGRFSIAPDGRIWIRSRERLFCFNAAGQGGEVVGSAARAPVEPPSSEMVRCLEPSQSLRDPAVELLPGHGRQPWRTTLDQTCKGEPVTGLNGKFLVQTQSRTLYLLSPEGNILWTYTAPCILDAPLLLADDTAVGVCSSRDRIVGVRDGQQQFSRSSKYTLSPPFGQDRANNLYRLEETGVYDKKLLIQTDSKGRDIWTMPVRLPLSPTAVMGPDGILYLTDRSPGGALLLVIGDKAR